MSAQPARRADAGRRDRTPRPRPQPASRPRATTAAAERRRRERHLRRRRRDLLEDFGIALVLMIVAVIVTSGLAVIALIEVPVATLVLASFWIERRRSRRARRD